jgi:predicted TIM-barrel fold metal-dependent hydrolase
MQTIDADAHVVETEQTWDYIDPADARYRPSLVSPRGESGRQYWMVDGKIRGLARQVITAQQFAALSERAGRKMDTPKETREMENIEARVRHMDELGIDVQVLHPTVFIELVADSPEADVPICRSYNRWLADIWAQGKGRLRWSCVPPLLDIPSALDEIRFSKEHGACAVFMRSIEGERMLQDPYFFPVYEEASRLDLAIAVHIANSNSAVVDLVGQRNDFSAFWKFRLPTIGAFHSVVMTGLPERFPKLRFGFIEAAAGWVPYTLNDIRRRAAARGRPLPDDIMRDYRLYVTCQTDDDVPYILQKAGEDNIVIGTDYGHSDQSTEVEALRTLRESGGITGEQYEKIVDHNPRALYSV